MAKTLLHNRPAIWRGLGPGLAAALAFVATGWLGSTGSLICLLLADALVMTALCAWLGYGSSRVSALWARAGACLAMLGPYAAVVAVVVGLPMNWLHEHGSLGATLAVSSAVLIVLLGLWRIWPAVGMVCHDAGRRRMSGGHGTLVRSFARAWSLTADNEVFFGHGLTAAVALLVLAQGALSLAGIGIPVAAAYHGLALAVYALVLVPLASWLIVWCSADAVRTIYRRTRVERVAQAVPAPSPPLPEEPDIPATLTPKELDAMLLRSVRASQTRLALAALERGANPHCVPDSADPDQRSVLVLAALNPDLRLLRGLIARGADPNRAHAGLAPLVAATRDSHEGRPESVMTLLTNGARPDCADSEGNTPLHFAALAAKPIVAALLCDAGAALDAVNRHGLTPLGVACAAANWELVRFLLDSGAAVEVEHAQPALLAACTIAEDDDTGVRLLLRQRRTHVDATGALARTALMTAALHGHARIAQVLIEAGAEVDCVDACGATALIEAARAGAHDVLDALAPRRPAPDRVDHAGRSALMIACQSLRADEETVRRLLALGASNDLAMADGRRAVDFAAAAGRWHIVRLLDPEYPQPASVADPGLPQAEAAAHLLDALRFGHWQIADGYAQRLRDWPAAESGALLIALFEHDDPAAWRWLLNRGVDADAPTAEHGTVTGAALARLPATLPVATDLLAAGAKLAGTRVVAQCCAAMRRTHDLAQRTALETLALCAIVGGAECFASDPAGNGTLAEAVATGSVALTRTLLAQGIDPNMRDARGRTPLFAAVQAPAATAVALIKELLRAGACPETAAGNGETPLGLALAQPDCEFRDWLNWPGWKLPRRPLRSSDLIAAAAQGDVAAVDKLLDLGLQVDAADARGATALMRAAGGGHAPLVRLLLERGADPARTAHTGATALSAATSARREEAVVALLEHGAMADQRLTGGGTALMIAAGFGYPELVAALLANGAAVDAEDQHGIRPLHAAAQFAFHGCDLERALATLRHLLAAGAAVDARNGAGQSPLLLLLGAGAEPGAAVEQDDLLVLLQLMLEYGADLQIQDRRGVGVLHACAMHGLLQPARALLAAGADPHSCDQRGRTPREVAHMLGFVDIAAELRVDEALPGAAQILRAPAIGTK